jgi:hypothetical protein
MRPWQRGIARLRQWEALASQQAFGWLRQRRNGGEPYLLRPRCCRNEQYAEFK